MLNPTYRHKDFTVKINTLGGEETLYTSLPLKLYFLFLLHASLIHPPFLFIIHDCSQCSPWYQYPYSGALVLVPQHFPSLLPFTPKSLLLIHCPHFRFLFIPHPQSPPPVLILPLIHPHVDPFHSFTPHPQIPDHPVTLDHYFYSSKQLPIMICPQITIILSQDPKCFLSADVR